MINNIFSRFKEPSSYAGLAGILVGISQLFKVEEAAPLADVAVNAGQAVATTGSAQLGFATLLAGVLAIFMPEGKK